MIYPIKSTFPTYTRHDRPKKENPQDRQEEPSEKEKKPTPRNGEKKSLSPKEMENMLATKAGLPDINARFQKIKAIQEKALRETMAELDQTKKIIEKLHNL